MNKNGVGMPTTKGEDREGLRESRAIYLETKVYIGLETKDYMFQKKKIACMI